jgi:hypothetical protein
MLYYTDVPGATQTTNATANTANDCFYIVPGSSRSVGIKTIYPTGRGATLTAISGISYRLEKWTTTASSGGTSITPTPDESGYAAASHTAGFSASTVTSGTGGPTLLLSIGSGTTSPGNWQAPSFEEGYRLYAGQTQSMDIWNISGAASLVFELSVGTWE